MGLCAQALSEGLTSRPAGKQGSQSDNQRFWLIERDVVRGVGNPNDLRTFRKEVPSGLNFARLEKC